MKASLTGSSCTNRDGAWNEALPGTRTFISVLLTSGREHDWCKSISQVTTQAVWLNMSWVGQKHSLPFVKRTSIIKGNRCWVTASIHLSIHLWLWETCIHPFDGKIANVSAARSVKAVTFDWCGLVRTLGIHWPTSLTLSRRLAPFVSSAHATQTYNCNAQPLTFATPLTFPCLISVPHIMQKSLGSKRISLDMWCFERIWKVSLLVCALSDLHCTTGPVRNVTAVIAE